jgi:hypothetical protein
MIAPEPRTDQRHLVRVPLVELEHLSRAVRNRREREPLRTHHVGPPGTTRLRRPPGSENSARLPVRPALTSPARRTPDTAYEGVRGPACVPAIAGDAGCDALSQEKQARRRSLRDTDGGGGAPVAACRVHLGIVVSR